LKILKYFSVSKKDILIFDFCIFLNSFFPPILYRKSEREFVYEREREGIEVGGERKERSS